MAASYVRPGTTTISSPARQRGHQVPTTISYRTVLSAYQQRRGIAPFNYSLTRVRSAHSYFEALHRHNSLLVLRVASYKQVSIQDRSKQSRTRSHGVRACVCCWHCSIFTPGSPPLSRAEVTNMRPYVEQAEHIYPYVRTPRGLPLSMPWGMHSVQCSVVGSKKTNPHSSFAP